MRIRTMERQCIELKSVMKEQEHKTVSLLSWEFTSSLRLFAVNQAATLFHNSPIDSVSLYGIGLYLLDMDYKPVASQNLSYQTRNSDIISDFIG